MKSIPFVFVFEIARFATTSAFDVSHDRHRTPSPPKRLFLPVMVVSLY